MKTYTYHKEIRILLAQVLNALGDLVIYRLDEKDDASYTDYIDVSLKFVSKQRIIYDMVNLNQHIQLPAMAISLQSLQYDSQRAFNKIAGFTTSIDYMSGGGSFPQPVPIKMVLPFSILARYQRDLDQIITCIFSNFYPYIVISYKHPDLGHEVRCVVMWNGDINFQYPIDTTHETSYRIAADSSFTVQGWIYKNANNPAGIIYNIPTTFSAVSSLLDSYDVERGFLQERTDVRCVSGRPQIKVASPYIINHNSDNMTVDIVGDMFHLVEGLAVSGINVDMYPFAEDGVTGMDIPVSCYNVFDPFADNKSLSSIYTSFSAVSVTNWELVNDNRIRFELPKPLSAGFVDVFAWSEAGFGKLSEDAMRITFNPYTSGTPEYDDFVNFQFPYVSGLEIT